MVLEESKKSLSDKLNFMTTKNEALPKELELQKAN